MQGLVSLWKRRRDSRSAHSSLGRGDGCIYDTGVSDVDGNCECEVERQGDVGVQGDDGSRSEDTAREISSAGNTIGVNQHSPSLDTETLARNQGLQIVNVSHRSELLDVSWEDSRWYP